MLLFYAKSPKMLSDTCCKNFILFGWQTKKLAFWGGHFCHFPQNFVSTVRHEFLTKWPWTKPPVVSNMSTITSRISTMIHFKWPALWITAYVFFFRGGRLQLSLSLSILDCPGQEFQFNFLSDIHDCEHKNTFLNKSFRIKFSPPNGYETDLGREKEEGECRCVCVAKTITKPGSRLICFCHSSVQKKSALILSYNNNITKVLHTFLWNGGMFTK